MLFLSLTLMVLLAWRLGVFDEIVEHRRLQSMDRELWLEIDEATWEDRQKRFRVSHPHLSRKPYMSLGRRR